MENLENFGSEDENLRIGLINFDDDSSILFDFDEYENDRTDFSREIRDAIDNLDFSRSSLVRSEPEVTRK